MPTMLSLLALLLLSQTSVEPATASAADPTEPYREAAIERWEETIQELERRNETEPKVEDGILFVGSSSIRMWEPEQLAKDMAPYPTIQRGYGGAKYSDLAVFAERVIHPHDFRAMVMFVANDVAGTPNDKSAEEVDRLVRYILDKVREKEPEAPVFIVEVTPTPSRDHVWDQTRQLNAALREIALAQPNTYFVATADHYLDAKGEPRPELFLEDQLHQNRAGYEIWASLIKGKLDQVLGGE